MKCFNLDFSFSAHSGRFFLACHNVFIAPKDLNYEPKLNLLIKVSFDNKYSFPGGFIPPTFKSFFLFSILTFFTNAPYLIYQEKGILNNYETISAQSSSMINKQ